MTNYSEFEVLEMAKALGFSSTEEMKSHQEWLDKQQEHRIKVREVVKNNGNVIDLRDL